VAETLHIVKVIKPHHSVSLYTFEDNVFQHPAALYFSHMFTFVSPATCTTQDTADENMHKRKKKNTHTHTQIINTCCARKGNYTSEFGTES
jgi:hypothetical protein